MKNVLITGASKGIGLETAKLLTTLGYKVFITSRSEEKLKEVVSDGFAFSYLAGDLIDKEFCKKLVLNAKQELGSIDILINNAGDYVWSEIEKTKCDDISRILKLNLEAPYRLISLCVEGMKKQKQGRIINIGSISGAVGEANASLYSASKSGLIGMTKSLGLELAEFGITVNTINPGWVKTDLIDGVDEEEQIDMIPQRRFIAPEEVARLVKYLVSQEAKGLTGQNINLCAGLSIG